MELIDVRTSDGSRHFARLPARATFDAFCAHVALLPGVEVLGSITENGGKPWMEFACRGHRFKVSSHDGLFHFDVCDPMCPDLILCQVVAHCERLLGGEAAG